MGRLRLSFAGLELEFADRDVALGQIGELAERGTRFPLVIYGPEGCGKTALLRQAKALLEDHGYDVVYASPLSERIGEALQYTPTIRGVVEDVLRLVPDPYSRLVDIAISIASQALGKLRRSRLAVLMDDVFQAVGVDKAEQYVKALLIEWPPREYEKMVVLVASSEGISRERVGRHRWADLFIMWNMSREGFRELYEKLPGSKPKLKDVWRSVGGTRGT